MRAKAQERAVAPQPSAFQRDRREQFADFFAGPDIPPRGARLPENSDDPLPMGGCRSDRPTLPETPADLPVSTLCNATLV